MDHAAKGKQLLLNSKYEEAIEAYTAALKASPTSPDYLIQRCTALQRAQRYPEALADAELAVVNAQKRAKRESIIEAQLRRGMVLWLLERYGDSKLALEVVKRMDAKNKSVDMWLHKVKKSLEGLPEDDEKAKVSISETPIIEMTQPQSLPFALLKSTPPSSSTAASTSSPEKPSVPAPIQQTAADKIRYEWYQNTDNVYFTLLAKGVPKDKAQIDITERSMTISFPIGTSGSTYDLTLDPLFAPVNPDKCIPRVMPSKVEVVLVKATPGQKWSGLESKEPVTEKPASTSACQHQHGESCTHTHTVFKDTKPTGPAYPTSSKSGPKDWDKITTDLSKSNSAGKEGEANGEDEDVEGDPANHFFKKLFKNASPDMQRAMMKSYQESNGTSLSTDWSEVSKGKVETLPPDGMVAKKW